MKLQSGCELVSMVEKSGGERFGRMNICCDSSIGR